MSVRIIDRSEFLSSKLDSKSALFIADIREIIDNRIEYCELENYPYSFKTPLADVMLKAKRVFAQYFWDATGHSLNDEIPFIMTKVTDENEQKHIYCAFNVKRWDEMINVERWDEMIKTAKMKEAENDY